MNIPENVYTNSKKTRHILALSGGKDSSALAVFLRGKIPDIEYVFCDTEKELLETYDYIGRLEGYLGKRITRLKYLGGYGFDEILQIKNGYLPSPNARWCTEYLKLKPYEKYIGDDPVVSYVGIRADEPHRKGYISQKPNITSAFPFIENNIRHEDVLRILNESGLGLPSYYKWRSRSGCYFCFFQQKREWVGLLENHPDLFIKAIEYEKSGLGEGGVKFTWNQDESLEELSKPERVQKIKQEYEKRKSRKAELFKGSQRLKDIWDFGEEGSVACNICHL